MFVIKFISILCLILVLVLSGLSYATCYWLGYFETPTAFSATDPLLTLLIEFCLFLILISLLIASLFKKKLRLWMICTIGVFCGLIFLDWSPFLPAHGPLVLYGLRDRVIRDYSLNELRHFALDVSQGIHPGTFINHGDISGLSESEKMAHAKLREKYPFMHWMDDGRIFHGPSIMYENGTGINVEWGGPLTGHWGFNIAFDRAKNTPPADPDTMVLPASDDIYFYKGD